MSNLSQSGQRSIVGMMMGCSSKDDLEFEKRQRDRIEARRKRDEERVRKLILNPKQRVMGVHADSLSRQIQEKDQRLMKEKERDLAFAMEQERIRSYLGEAESEEKKARRQAQKEIRSVWDAQIKHSQEKKQASFEDDATTERAKLMVFEGEDLLRDRRVADQMKQHREYLDRQIQERREREQANRDNNLNNATQWAAIDRHQAEIEKQLERERRERFQALAQQNRRIGEERKELEKRRRKEQLEEEKKQLSCVQKLNESTKCPLSESQLREIRAEQARQRLRCEERNARREQEKLEELQRMRLLTRELERAEEESKISRIEKTRAYREELDRFSSIRREQQEEAKSSGGIDFNSSFFSKFGTSAR
jgi:hypothetical protein